jgi:hypothetical protein
MSPLKDPLADWTERLSFRVKLALLVNLLVLLLIGSSAFLVEQRQRPPSSRTRRALVMAEALAGAVSATC